MKAPPDPWTWSAPLHRSRCGASHQRRGVPCQDASLSANLRSADGVPIGLMAVADGHGGSRYWLSDVGSRLACELAIQTAAQALAQQRLATAGLNQLQSVHDWLADALPTRLVAAWREAIQTDWHLRELPPDRQDQAFAAEIYGSTLALVVLTPQWWGHTGLGDWDLVLLSNDKPDRIISQEVGNSLQGEATESLCLTRASACFSSRTAVYPLSDEHRQACGLVLTTDGIRKSCASDADHLALSRYLLDESQPHQSQVAGVTERLDASLDRISREGSGDDVSVALACFGPWRPTAADPSAPLLTELPELPELPPLPDKPSSPSSSSNQQQPERRQQRPSLAILLGVLVIASAGLAVFGRFGHPAPWMQPQKPPMVKVPQRPALTAAQQLGLHQEIRNLCSQPELIAANLRTRNKQFEQLRNNPAELSRVLMAKDWLGALIGLSQPGGPSLGDLELCPKLATALSQHWQVSLTPQAAPATSNEGLRTGQRSPNSP